MAQSKVLLSALLINILSYCSAENVCCVRPNTTTCSSCPQNYTHCATLSEYAQEEELYFISNTTMVFLPGNHTLDTNITVVNIDGLTLRGESAPGNSATVICNGSVGLSFTRVMDFKMYSLAFSFCSRSFDSTLYSSFALLLVSIEYAELVDCSFHDNFGTALGAVNTNITMAGHSEFIHNHCENLCITGGGGIAVFSSNTPTVLTFNGTSNFLGNSVGTSGGAIFASNTILNFNGTSNFINNAALSGGAIAISGNTVTFNGTSNFINNSAGVVGGAILSAENTITVFVFNGTSNFINNSADDGGAISANGYTVLRFNGNHNFVNNSGTDGGVVSTFDTSVLRFKGTSKFINNSAFIGGAIYARHNTEVSFSGTSIFTNNSADSDGGAIYALGNSVFSFNGTNNFINNLASGLSFSTRCYGGGAIYTSDNTSIRFNGTSKFANNLAKGNGCRGGAIFISGNAVLSFNKSINFVNNSVTDSVGGAIIALDNAALSFNGTSIFISNSAGSDGGAIHASGDSTLTFISGTNNFINNSAHSDGGALYLDNSTFSILPKTIIVWEKNHAIHGGAIYVDDKPFIYCTQADTCTTSGNCFFQLPHQNLSKGIHVQLVFKNNSADAAGSVLYGGAIDNCKLMGLDSCKSGEVFDMLVNIEDDNTNSTISSLPFRVCPCENNYPDCSKSHISYTLYPGETFDVAVGAYGQRNGAVPSAVRSLMKTGNLLGSQYIQQANDACTTFNYTVFSLLISQPLKLYTDGPCSIFSDTLLIYLNMNQYCPPGFNLSEPARSCVCEPRLEKYTNNCNITNGLGQITRNLGQQFWVGYDRLSHGLIIHPLCPFDYCVSHTVVFPLNNTDKQCAYNRSGLLCGACKEGYSLVLGTSHCKQCSNSYLTLLIPFAGMGLALVFLLLVCNLTVAEGTLSGLVFYANIVGVNRTIFLPVESSNPLSVFIAWINLDFGIETCFFDGLDAYSQTWLQFVFPVNIWVLIGLIILVSKYSPKFTKFLGNNPVSVLATLILLSYAKILRTLIAALYLTYLAYPKHNRGVWLYDANIDYLSSKHIPLFIVAVFVFFFLFLPYSILLLFGPWLQAISHPRHFSLVINVKLKPFIDSYHAPYKEKHRYWPGLLLMLRFVLFLVFAFEFNPQQDTSVDLLAILVGTGVLVVWAWISGGVYKNWYLDALEGSFALNLIILAAATMYSYHVSHAQKIQLAIGYTSVITALVTFIGILTFHLANVTKKKCTASKKCIKLTRNGESELDSDTDSLPDRMNNPGREYEPLLPQAAQEDGGAEPVGSDK